jgi:hypothetical protein
MVWFRRAYMAVAISVTLTVVTAPASAQSVTYSLAGVETAATSTQGTFVGVALSPDDFGTWGAVVDHEPLDDTVAITGGTFSIDGQVRDLHGTIAEGTIENLPGGSCRKDTFAVTGQLNNVVDSDGIFNGGFGLFSVTLTHYGRRVPGGACVTFFATIEGLVTFMLSSTEPN